MSRRKRLGRVLSDDEGLVLSMGPGIISFTTIEDVFGTMENARAAWAIHGARLTAEQGGPGRQLWGWLQFQATEQEIAGENALRADLLEQQQWELRSQPTRDPADSVVPQTRRLVLPQHDSNGNGRPA